MHWSYGITAVPERINYPRCTLFDRTLRSLKVNGFDKPRIFLDGALGLTALDGSEHLVPEDICVRGKHKIKAFGNWALAIFELYIREPRADRYAVFQDDIVVGKNLRAYLESIPFPEKGYWNLYTAPSNDGLVPDSYGKDYVGFYPSNQFGRGALALVFNREGVLELLSSRKFLEWPLRAKNPTSNLDGAIITALSSKGFKEYVHTPGLVLHTGLGKSSIGGEQQPLTTQFRGEDFDLMTLAKEIVKC
jgi:hypothetical protein